MKLNSYIKEGSLSEQNRFEEFILNVKRNCKPWLNAISKCDRKTLTRGYVPKKDIERISPRRDRRPRDTDKPLHKAMNKEFYKKFKWKPRSEGLFTFGGRIGGGYGMESGYVFPISKFDFVWSEKIRDFFLWANTHYKPPGIKNSKEEQQYRQKWCERTVGLYDNKDLYKALNSTSEIIIKCDMYYIIRRKFLLDMFDYDDSLNSRKMDKFIEERLLK